MSNALTLLGAVALFAAVSSALFFLPGWEVVLYPLYGLIFLWNDHRHDDEMYIIFVFLATAAAFLLMARETAAPARAGLAVEALGVWILCFGIGYHRGMLGAARTAAFAETDKLEAVAKDAERELKFYGTYEASAVAQIRLRRDLTQAAKSLGTTMDADEVSAGWCASSRAATRHQGGSFRDPRTRWSTGRSRPRPPCWCGHEGRGPLRAAPASAPSGRLWSSPHGGPEALRLPAPRLPAPDAYTSDDLRTVDLFATLASMTLENIRLYEEAHQLAIPTA